MKRIIIALLLIPYLNIFAQSTGLHVTIYNDDFGLIKENRKVTVNRGETTVKISEIAEKIIPATVHAKINAKIIEQNFRYDLAGANAILNKYIGSEIVLSKDKTSVSGKLASFNYNRIVLENKSGGLLIIPNYTNYQISTGSLPRGFMSKPTIFWQVESDRTAFQNMELSYRTKGLDWHAEYTAVLNEDETEIALNAWVSIENTSGMTYKDAKLKLVAGEVNSINRSSLSRGRYVEEVFGMAVSNKQKSIRQKLYEYHSYDIPNKTTISNNEIKQIALFEAESIKIMKKYRYYVSGASAKENPSVIIEFENSEANNLGNPLPEGIISLNKTSENSFDFLGEDEIEHTPKDETVSIESGKAFDIIAESRIKESNIDKDKYKTSKYQVTISNRKDEDIEIEIENRFNGDFKILESRNKYEKIDASTIRFTLKLKKGEQKTITYKVKENVG